MIRACFDQSKAGHSARDTLENMNKQMTAALEEVDRQIEEISAQLDDENNRDSMTPEAEKQLQDKFESLSQERELRRMQFSQQMNQSQMMIMQKIYDHVSRASEKVAKEMNLDLIVQEDSTLYFAAALDITQPVLQTMDKMSEEEAASEASKEAPKEAPKK
jgi:Skp family chaperone for outer membrane proteins